MRSFSALQVPLCSGTESICRSRLKPRQRKSSRSQCQEPLQICGRKLCHCLRHKVLRFPSLLLSQACLSLLQFAWAALNFHSLSGQQGVQRNQGDPVRELGNCQVAPVLKLHRLCGKSSAESYERAVSLQMQLPCLFIFGLLGILGFCTFFLLHIIALLPKGLGTRHVNVDLASVKGLRPAFVSFFLTKVDKRLYNSLWS